MRQNTYVLSLIFFATKWIVIFKRLRKIVDTKGFMEATMIIFRTKWGSFLLLKKGYLRKKILFRKSSNKIEKNVL